MIKNSKIFYLKKMYSNLSIPLKAIYAIVIPIVWLIIYIIVSSFSLYFYNNKESMKNYPKTKKLISLIFYFSAFMTIYCYTLSIFTDPGTIENDKLNVLEKDDKTFCKKCDVERPLRAHHCSTCNKCILKLDHHCPWIFNCVGYYNQKFFLLFLFYGTIGDLIAFFCIGNNILKSTFHDMIYNNFEQISMEEKYFLFKILILIKHPLWIIFSTLISLVMTLIIGILFFIQLFNIIFNVTSIEKLIYKTYDKCPFYAEKNYRLFMIKTVLGFQIWKWFLPIFEENKFNGGYTFDTPYERLVKEDDKNKKKNNKFCCKYCFCCPF